jgi:hypothetical protein
VQPSLWLLCLNPTVMTTKVLILSCCRRGNHQSLHVLYKSCGRLLQSSHNSVLPF